jgi:hypothetical protein
VDRRSQKSLARGRDFRNRYANLRRAALRAEGLAIFDDVPALIAGMVHGNFEKG